MKITYFLLANLILATSINSQDSLKQDEVPVYTENIDTSTFTALEIKVDSLFYEEDVDIFEAQMDEAKAIFSEAIISDLTGDTLEAMYQFDLLFESLSALDFLSKNGKDEFQKLEFNRILTATIDYYEDESNTIDKVETGLSVAVFRDKLNEYIYSQTLEDLEFVEERIEVIPGHIPITYNQKVASIIKFFQNEGRSSVQKWLNRMDRYKKIMLPILEQENVPPELFYLAMIESGLNPEAYSYAHASGPWQFISSTGKAYGLKKNWWVDERRDFEKSTHAAAQYLKDLHEKFDDWYLAFASYNCGSGRVRKEIKRHGTTDYWKLSRLPGQTRNYVPNIMAAIFIATDPQRYGFVVTSESEMNWSVKELDKSVSLEVLSELSGIEVKQLQSFNPELRQGTIPPLKENETYRFRLPEGYNIKFDSLYAAIEIEKVDEIVFVDHKVKRGESLWLIARKYGVRVKDIVVINKLGNAKYIRPGQHLQIPTDGYAQYRKTSMVSSSKSKKIYHTVRRGDTLSEIAMKYRTSIRKVKKWNGLRSNRIYVGQKLKIWKST
jgi:membrane-bound lytic murein transglycosylase D